MNNERILEIAYCIEKQFEPDTRLILEVCGMWRRDRRFKYTPYQSWINDLFKEATNFYLKEVLKQEKKKKRSEIPITLNTKDFLKEIKKLPKGAYIIYDESFTKLNKKQWKVLKELIKINEKLYLVTRGIPDKYLDGLKEKWGVLEC